MIAGLLVLTWLSAASWETVAVLQQPAQRADDPDAKLVAQRKFPWFDDQKQAYRPLKPPKNWLQEWWEWLFGRSNDAETRPVDLSFMRYLLYLLAFGVIVWLGYLFYHSLQTDGPPMEAEPAMPVLDAARLEALPAAVRNVTDFLGEANRLVQAGDYNLAMVFYFSWQLVILDQALTLELEIGKINRQYVLETSSNRPDLSDLFLRSTRLFEDAFYGNLPLEREAFLEIWQRRDEFRPSSLKPGRRR